MQSSHASSGDRRAPRPSREITPSSRALADDTGPRRRASDPRLSRGLEEHIVLGERVARGATSVVHRGRHRELDVDVAVKVLDERHVDDAGIIARLEREARMLVTLREPGIVRVLDLARLADGRRAMVMEWIDGESLEQRLRRETRIGTCDAVSIAISVCRSLAFAHARGVMHRDVKPSNVMLAAGGQTVLIDFGVARGPGASSETVTGGLLGTPAYMAPEQARDASRVLPAADVYSVGAMLFRMLSGEPPYPADDPWATLHRLANERPRALTTLVSDVSPSLATLVDRCLARDPSLRPRNAAELLRCLESISAEDPNTTTSARSAHPRLVLSMGGLGVSMATSAIVSGLLTHPLRPEGSLLVALVVIASLASAFAWILRERARGGSVVETERRLAECAKSSSVTAAMAAGFTSLVCATLAAFDVAALGTSIAILVGLVAFARGFRTSRG